MNRLRLFAVSALILLSAVPSVAKTKEEKQAEARRKAAQTLERLYKVHPSARAAINGAAGEVA